MLVKQVVFAFSFYTKISTIRWDYVIKPFSPKELEARVKAVLRRTVSKDITIPTGKTTKNVITTGKIICTKIRNAAADS